MFEVAEAYERQMGRWSRRLAALLIEFVDVREGGQFLDAGCCTGSVSRAMAELTKAANISREISFSEVADFTVLRLAQREMGIQ